MGSALSKSFRENDELVADLARFSEALISEAAIRRKYRDVLGDEAWESMASDDLLVEMIEAEKVRRIRNGSYKRERAQQIVTKAPDVLGKILEDERANPRHRIDSAKALDDLAGFAPQRNAEDQDRVVIRIDLSADTKDPRDVLTFEATPRPRPNDDGRIIDVVPSERPSMIEASNQFDRKEPVKRGRGRPKGSRNKPKSNDEAKLIEQPGLPGFDVR